MADELVLVTGASGFIATHVVKLLQEQGYRVRGTVRSLKNEAKVKPIYELCPDAKHPIELVEADLLNEESWGPIVKGCKYVLHIASPLPDENPAHENEVIKPAVDSKLSVLKACDAGVKRVVLTSSTAAVTSGADVSERPWTEEDWTDPARVTIPFIKSMALAEKAAWEFVKDLPEDKKFELVVINPGYVVGPLLCGAMTMAMEIPRMMLERQTPGLVKFGMGVIDVRDVALAHVNALTAPEASGHRHILVTESLSMKDMALILDEEFRPQGYNVPTWELPSFMVKFASFFVKSVKIVASMLDVVPRYDNTRMKTVLSISPRNPKSSFTDMAYSMIERGHIKKTDEYTGPKFSE